MVSKKVFFIFLALLLITVFFIFFFIFNQILIMKKGSSNSNSSFKNSQSLSPTSLPQIPTPSPILNEKKFCPSLEKEGYQLADKNNSLYRGQPKVYYDLNKDSIAELVVVYNEKTGDFLQRSKPIILKIYSLISNCYQEVFSFIAQTDSYVNNEVLNMTIYPNFWSDQKDVVVLEAIDTGYGSSYDVYHYFITFENNIYQNKEMIKSNSDDIYQFFGKKYLGEKIIWARMTWLEEDQCHFCPHRYLLEEYIWDGNRYSKREIGLTKNKYSPDHISFDQIKAMEKDWLNLD